MALRLSILLFVAFLAGACGQPMKGVHHTVQRGETLYRIGKTYGVDSRRIARVNRVYDPQSLRVGQRLYIPGADRIKKVPPLTTSVPPPSKPPPSPPKTVKKKIPPPPKPSPVPAAPLPTQKEISAPRLQWPVKGKVVRNFNPTAANPSRGVEISVPFGSPVFSAASGKVIYSGNGIRGYGNLLIIEHEGSFFTVYGFNKSNLVHTGAFVGKGEKIALAGNPPDGRAARLHFQLRQGKKVLDPLLFLP